MSKTRIRNKTAKTRGGDFFGSLFGQQSSSETVSPSAPSNLIKDNTLPNNTSEIESIKSEIKQLSERVSKLENKPIGGKSKNSKSKKRTHK